MNIRFAIASCLAAALGMSGAAAQTLYKLIDKNGKVTYSESPPKDYDGKVIRMDIDPNANTATLPKPKAADPNVREGTEGVPRNAPSPKKLTADEAREKVARAKKAYQDALDNPGESDVSRIGNAKGGTRPVFSEAYAARLAALEEAVKKAEEDLKRAEGG